jgi:uncharacterized protein (TIGR02271 family)
MNQYRDPMNILRDTPVLAADGPVGRVEHLVLDERTGTVTDLIVSGSGLKWLVPISAVASSGPDLVVLRGPWADYEAVGRLSSDALRPLDSSHRPGLAGRTSAYPAGLHGDRDTGERPSVADTGPWQVELLEERLRVAKEREQLGTVRIGKHLVEHEESVTIPVHEERIVIERRPGSGRVLVDGRELGADETIEIPVMRDRARAVKQPVVIEEITVRKEILEHNEQATETLRREELYVDDGKDFVKGKSNGSGSAFPRPRQNGKGGRPPS